MLCLLRLYMWGRYQRLMCDLFISSDSVKYMYEIVTVDVREVPKTDV